MRTHIHQPPYGPHLPDRLRNEGWWLDFSQQTGSEADQRSKGRHIASKEEGKFHDTGRRL